MKFSTSSFVMSALLTAAWPCLAQQESAPAAPKADAPAAPAAASTTATSTDPNAPSEETLRRAKSVGMHAEKRSGKTQYCWEDTTIGSHFTTKKCTDENGLNGIIAQREDTKQSLRQSMSGTSSH